jgi:hypothetical protein
LPCSGRTPPSNFATTTTTNASQFGVGFAVGFQFTVSCGCTVEALEAFVAPISRLDHSSPPP